MKRVIFVMVRINGVLKTLKTPAENDQEACQQIREQMIQQYGAGCLYEGKVQIVGTQATRSW